MVLYLLLRERLRRLGIEFHEQKLSGRSRRVGRHSRCIGGTSAQNLLHNCVEAAAAGALNPEKVPLSIGRLGLTVIAHDIHRTLEIGWHGVLGNVPGAGFPRGRHALLTDDGLLANGAAIIKASQFAEAMGVNGVPARQILRTLSTAKHIFTADGTIVLVLVLEALVAFKDANADAHAALVTL